jgi:hypothetical protein
LCENDNCKICFDKSFASHEKSKYWLDRNEKSPRNTFLQSNKKCWFKCENNHEFESVLSTITTGRWCPKCKNKTEKKLLDILSEDYDVLHQSKYDWCKNGETNKYLPFDFELIDYKIILELDGEQHFKQIANWKSPEETLKRDI